MKITDGGSLVLQGFSSPTLFFNDAFPGPEGETVGEVMESALTLLMERRMALLFDIRVFEPLGHAALSKLVQGAVGPDAGSHR